jgi:hypothetical protein
LCERVLGATEFVRRIRIGSGADHDHGFIWRDPGILARASTNAASVPP